jgi:hypothetical protein
MGEGRREGVGEALPTDLPRMTSPKTTCLSSRCGVGTVVMKNWEPFVFGPELA